MFIHKIQERLMDTSKSSNIRNNGHNKPNNNNKQISRVPWSDYQEWKNCYDFLFSNKYGISGKKIEKISDTIDFFIDNLDFSNLQKAYNILNIWNSRSDSNTYVLATFLLLEEIIKIINNAYYSFNINDIKHILSQKIIRLTNLIIDDLKKKNKKIASNMFLVAKAISLPEFIIEIRHICTHKVLPDLNTLLFTVKYLYFWIKENYWDKQYKLFNQQQSAKEQVLDILQALEKLKNYEASKEAKFADAESISLKRNLQSFEDAYKSKENLKFFKFEINNLFDIIAKVLASFIKFSIFTQSGKVINEKIKEFGVIFAVLFEIEGELLILLIYKFISEFIFKEIALKIFNGLKADQADTSGLLNTFLQSNKNLLKKFLFLIHYIQKYLKDKSMSYYKQTSGFEYEKDLEDKAKPKNQKNTNKANDDNHTNNNSKDANTPVIMNALFQHIYRLFKFSSDFSSEIKEIFEVFLCNFKHYSMYIDTENVNNCNNRIEDYENFISRKRLRNSSNRINDYNDCDYRIEKCEIGSLLFKQLESFTSNEKDKEENYYNYNDSSNVAVNNEFININNKQITNTASEENEIYNPFRELSKNDYDNFIILDLNENK